MFTPRAKRGILMFINVQLMIINVQKNTSAKRDVNINHIRKKYFFVYIIGCDHFLSKESVSLPTYMAFLPFWSTGTALPSALLT